MDRQALLTAHASGRRPGLLRNEAAYSLPELLLVLFLLALLMAVAMPAMGGHSEKRTLEIAARGLVVDLRRARQLAITTGQPHCVDFFTREEVSHYRIKNCATVAAERIYLPAGTKIAYSTFPGGGNYCGFRFSPAGSPSSGGTLALRGGSGMTLYVIVAPATGRVRFSSEPPDY